MSISLFIACFTTTSASSFPVMSTYGGPMSIKYVSDGLSVFLSVLILCISMFSLSDLHNAETTFDVSKDNEFIACRSSYVCQSL